MLHAHKRHERLLLALSTAVSIRGQTKSGAGGSGIAERGNQAGRLKGLLRGPVLEIVRYYDHLHAQAKDGWQAAHPVGMCA